MKATTAKTALRTKVLLADDDRANRRLLLQFLAKDYQVTSASNSAEALEAIENDEPDLVILDLETPEGNGFELLKQLRDAHQNVAVMVLAERGRTGDIPKALKLGAREYVVKPIDRNELKERVRRVIAGTRAPIPATVSIKVWLPELHDPQTGRIAADKVAEHMSVPLKQLAQAVGANYTTVHKTPAAESLQGTLKPVKRSLEILHELIRDPMAERAWLNSSHPDLGMRTPLQVILEGNAEALSTILENALEGIPS
jgi:DNA-binding response OmpR family regulator